MLKLSDNLFKIGMVLFAVPVLALMAVSFEPKAVGAPVERSASAVTGIVVRGFDQHTGRMIDDLSERSRNQLDLSVVAVVEIAGPRGAFDHTTAEITVQKGADVTHLSRPVGSLDERTGEYFIPVIVPGPNCDRVTIKAKLKGQALGTIVSKDISFSCGE